MYSPKKVVQVVKSIRAREVFRLAPEVKKTVMRREFLGKGYFINTLGQHGNEKSIDNYVKNQEKEKDYKVLHKKIQLTLF